jgi:hypothetical protein
MICGSSDHRQCGAGLAGGWSDGRFSKRSPPVLIPLIVNAVSTPS